MERAKILIETLPEIEKQFVHTNFHPLWSKYCLEIILKRSGLKFQDVMRIANQIEVKKFKIYVCMLADSGFFENILYQGGVKSTVFWGI